MKQGEVKRRLSGILSADVVGYSRLMGEGEAFTVRRVEEYQKLIFILVKENRPRRLLEQVQLA